MSLVDRVYTWAWNGMSVPEIIATREALDEIFGDGVLFYTGPLAEDFMSNRSGVFLTEPFKLQKIVRKFDYDNEEVNQWAKSGRIGGHAAFRIDVSTLKGSVLSEVEIFSTLMEDAFRQVDSMTLMHYRQVELQMGFSTKNKVLVIDDLLKALRALRKYIVVCLEQADVAPNENNIAQMFYFMYGKYTFTKAFKNKMSFWYDVNDSLDVALAKLVGQGWTYERAGVLTLVDMLPANEEESKVLLAAPIEWVNALL